MIASFVGTANYHKARGKANLGKAPLMALADTLNIYPAQKLILNLIIDRYHIEIIKENN